MRTLLINPLKDKRGQGWWIMVGLFTLLFVSLAIVFIFSYISIGIHSISDTLTNVTVDSNIVNVSDANTQIIQPLANGTDNLQLMSFVILFGYIIATLVIGYYSKENPIMFFLYFVMILLIVILSFYVSNAYDTVKSVGNVSQYTATDYMILHMPMITGVIGFAALAIMIIRYAQEIR